MKKIIIFILACMTAACSSASDINSDTIDPLEQNTFEAGYYANYKDGLFYVDMNDYSLNYLDQLDSKVYVTDVRYCDDYPYSQKQRFENYTDSLASSDIYIYDGKLFYIAVYMNAEGASSFKLYSLSVDGKKRNEIMEFQYDPTYFIIQNNLLFTVETVSSAESLIHVYRIGGKEVKKITVPGIAHHLFADGETIYFSSDNTETGASTAYEINTEDFTCEALLGGKDISFVFENEQKMAYYTLNQKFTDSVKTDDIVFSSKIYDFTADSDVFAVQDEIINYFDADYIYTSTLKKEAMTYNIYDWNGNTVSEITPSDDIGSSPLISSLFGNTDASQIIRIIDKKIIGYTMDDQHNQHFFACEIESGGCSVIGEQND
jgi:hypothetical protein